MGNWELAPRKIFRTTPFRMSENAFLEQCMKVTITIGICSRGGSMGGSQGSVTQSKLFCIK